jgi:hypothetical protein
VGTVRKSIASISFGIALAGFAGLCLFAWKSRQDQEASTKLIPIQQLAKAETLPTNKKREYFGNFIEENSSSSDEKIQDAVTSARMRLAYMDAPEKPEAARELFLEAEQKHSGSDAMDPNFGAMPDQARYQAINCLMIDGKTKQAKSEYFAFLKERPLSPLVFGVHKRLLKLRTEGESREEIDRLLQIAVDKQDEHGKREMALCGPRCIEKLAELHKGEQVQLSEIEKQAGTTLDGTSMSGMVKALGVAGFRAEGMLVNHADFQTQKLPFIWLDKGHYLLVHARKNNKFVVYDPFIRNDREITIPEANAQFSATILKISSKR